MSAVRDKKPGMAAPPAGAKPAARAPSKLVRPQPLASAPAVRRSRALSGAPSGPSATSVRAAVPASLQPIPAPTGRQPSAVIDSVAAEAAFGRANDAYRRGRYESAVAETNEALRLNPRFAEAQYLRGVAYLRDGALDRAMQDFVVLLAADPGNGSALLGKGAIYLTRNRIDDALAEFDRYIVLKPQHSAGFINRGRAHEIAGRLDAANADFETAVRLAPRDALALYHRAHGRLHAGDRIKSRVDFDAAVALEPRLGSFAGRLRPAPYLGLPGRTEIWEEPSGVLGVAAQTAVGIAAMTANRDFPSSATIGAVATLGTPAIDAALIGASSALEAKSYDKAIADAGVPVMSHVGMCPHFVHQYGGFKLQGKTAEEAMKIVDDAIQEAGCIGFEIEAVPAPVAAAVDAAVDIFTFGIGAGPASCGQLLLAFDLLGVFDQFKPKFTKRYADISSIAVDALKLYAVEVRAWQFPGAQHSYTMKPEEAEKLKRLLGRP